MNQEQTLSASPDRDSEPTIQGTTLSCTLWTDVEDQQITRMSWWIKDETKDLPPEKGAREVDAITTVLDLDPRSRLKRTKHRSHGDQAVLAPANSWWPTIVSLAAAWCVARMEFRWSAFIPNWLDPPMMGWVEIWLVSPLDRWKKPVRRSNSLNQSIMTFQRWDRRGWPLLIERTRHQYRPKSNRKDHKE